MKNIKNIKNIKKTEKIEKIKSIDNFSREAIKIRICLLIFVCLYLIFLYILNCINFNDSFYMGTNRTIAQVQQHWNGEFFEYIPGTTGLISINNSTQSQLEALNGIGSVIAERIIVYREENGDFLEIDDLLYVKGIGEATLNEIRSYIMIE